MLLPCGYVMGVHGALVAGIPGLKRETPRHAGAGWGTLRVFPTRCVQAIMYELKPNSLSVLYGLKAVPFKDMRTPL
jgi:hypothetical protein